MFKKFLAGLSAVALAIGMVAITAGPASAHLNTISASVACNTDAVSGYWKVTWTVTNSEGDKTERIIESSDTTLVPLGATLDPGASVQFVEYFAAPTSKTLTLRGKWSNAFEQTNFGSISSTQFSTDCVPDDTDTEVRLCHWKPLQQKWGIEYQSIASILSGGGHAGHQKDVIPPFDYVQSGTPGHYDGKNWTAYNRAVWDADCEKPTAAPTEPSFVDEVCTGPGDSSSANFTIPDVEGVQYQYKFLGLWVDVASGTHPVPGLNPTVGYGDLKLRAIPEPGYQLSGTTSWQHDFDWAGPCLVKVEAVPPVITQPVCTDPGKQSLGSYTIPVATGVLYKVWINDTFVGIVGPGTYDLNPGDGIKILALGDILNGYYILDGLDEQLFGPYVIVSAGDCLDEVTPVEPDVEAQTCVVDRELKGAYVDGSITIPATPGVIYKIDGAIHGAGGHPFIPGTYEVTAEAAPGHVLTGYPGPWDLTIVVAEPCGDLIVLPVVDPIVTFVQTTCSASGSYTLAVDPAEESAGVIWTVSSGLPNTIGTHSVATAGTVTVTATPAPGYGFTDDEDAFIQWSFDFTSLPGDCLPTLALTGAPVVGSLVGLWAGLTVAGVFLIAARRREQQANAE